jgi:cell division protein FtsB
MKKIKTPTWIKVVLGFILQAFEYVLYVHDRIIMSWTARTMVRIQVWDEMPEKKKQALGRVVVIWGGYFLYKLIF